MAADFATINAAASAKGKPLTREELNALNSEQDNETLRLRFIAVIRGAGYVNDAPERICAEWFPKYIVDKPSFIKMLEEYEKNNFDPE